MSSPDPAELRLLLGSHPYVGDWLLEHAEEIADALEERERLRTRLSHLVETADAVDLGTRPRRKDDIEAWESSADDLLAEIERAKLALAGEQEVY